MKTIEEIKNYIEEQEQNGALLVTGKWGSGKTYLMRQIERELNQGPQYLMAVVSLFGIEDTNTLTKKVKEAVAYAQTFNKAEKSGKGHIAKGVNAAKRILIAKLNTGKLDGVVGDLLRTSGGSTVWTSIKGGMPVRFKQGPGGKFFGGKENERFEGVLHIMAKWVTDEERLEFLRKFGYLMNDAAAKAYSAKFKPKR